jgi:hypothetical protein
MNRLVSSVAVRLQEELGLLDVLRGAHDARHVLVKRLRMHIQDALETRTSLAARLIANSLIQGLLGFVWIDRITEIIRIVTYL